MIVQDHNNGDEGIVDLLLHNQDRAFSIPELYEWVDNSNLQIIEHSLINRYKYKYNIHNLEYPEKIEDKYAINELFFGDIIKQQFYASKNKVSPPSCDNLECIPILHFINKEQIATIIENLPYNRENDKNNDLNKYYTYKFSVNPYIDGMYMKSVNVNINIENINDNHIQLDANDIWNCIEKMLYNIDNKKSIREILSIIERNIEQKVLLNIFKRLYESFLLYDLILLTY